MKQTTIIAWVRINGLVIVAIALTSLTGHLAGREYLYNWNASHAGMGLNTALEFLATGLSIFLISLLRDEEK